MQVEKHNTFIKLKIGDAREAAWLQNLLNNVLTTYSFSPDYKAGSKGRPKWVKEINKQYYLVIGRWYYIPGGFMVYIMESMRSKGITADITEVGDTYKSASIDIKMANMKPRGHQIEGMTKLTSADSRILLNAMYTGAGKAHHVDELVLTPEGYVAIGTIKAGDHVIGSDGKPTKVLQVHPQGVIPLFRMEFFDGVTNVCSGDHIWPVCVNGRDYVPMTVSEILEKPLYYPQKDKRYNTIQKHYVNAIPKAAPWLNENADPTPIDPYLFGCLLNDGCFQAKYVSITNGSKDLLVYLSKLLPEGLRGNISKDSENYWKMSIVRSKETPHHHHTNPMLNILKELGLHHKGTHEKFIPKQFLHASYEDRRRLFEGLIATNGYSEDGTRCNEYSTSSRSLAIDFLELGRSLGKLLKMSDHIPKYIHKGEEKSGKRNYHIRELKTQRKTITNIVPVKDGEAVCISVEAKDSLYITRGHTLTHNTITTFFLMEYYKKRTFLVMRPVYTQQWIESMTETTDIKRDDIIHIKNGNELRSLFAIPAGNHKVYIVSNSLYRNYVKEYTDSLTDDEVEFSYDVEPIDAMKHLKIGLLVIDEVDADFHMWSMMLMTMEIERVIALSATMVSLDSVTNNMFDNFTDKSARYDLFEEHPYISLFVYEYAFINPKRVKCVVHGGYNHNKLEEHISKTPSAKKAYMDAVREAYMIAHYNRCKRSEKCVVYFSRVETIKEFVEYMQLSMPELKVLVFIAGISAEELTDADLIVATQGKAGRGLDITGLSTIINTVNIKSVQTNLQLYGRLRMPKEGESERIAVQFVANNIKKHMEYSSDRHIMLKNKVKKTTLVKSKVRV